MLIDASFILAFRERDLVLNRVVRLHRISPGSLLFLLNNSLQLTLVHQEREHIDKLVDLMQIERVDELDQEHL